MNQTLFIAATHGDEPIGVRALEALEKKQEDFDWIIGNPRALKQEQRFTEADLNRSAPGLFTGATYESRRAAELLSLTKKYDAVIDLHGTTQDCGIFVIVTNPTDENLRLASMLDIERIVIWPAITPDLSGPLSEFFPVGLEIECGRKDAPETQKQLEKILTSFLENKEALEKQDWKKALRYKRVYEVYGELRKDPGFKLKEFQEVLLDGETFTPLLISVYNNMYGVVCYKLKKIKV